MLKGDVTWATDVDEKYKEEDHVAIKVTVPEALGFNKNVVLFFSPSGQNTMYDKYRSSESSFNWILKTCYTINFSWGNGAK